MADTETDFLKRLTSAWTANDCGNPECVQQRFNAALVVIYGGKTHDQHARLLLETIANGAASRKND